MTRSPGVNVTPTSGTREPATASEGREVETYLRAEDRPAPGLPRHPGPGGCPEEGTASAQTAGGDFRPARDREVWDEGVS